MRSIVVFDSQFGNTQEVAETIAAELQAAGFVDVEKVGTPAAQATFPTDIDLVIVGGPTQMHGISPGMRDYLDSIPAQSLAGMAVAAFDTRLAGWPLVTGAASGGIAKHLTKLGAQMVVPPKSFVVEGKEGPLAEGELASARQFAREVIAAMPKPAKSVLAAV